MRRRIPSPSVCHEGFDKSFVTEFFNMVLENDAFSTPIPRSCMNRKNNRSISRFWCRETIEVQGCIFFYSACKCKFVNGIRNRGFVGLIRCSSACDDGWTELDAVFFSCLGTASSRIILKIANCILVIRIIGVDPSYYRQYAFFHQWCMSSFSNLINNWYSKWYYYARVRWRWVMVGMFPRMFALWLN